MCCGERNRTHCTNHASGSPHLPPLFEPSRRQHIITTSNVQGISWYGKACNATPRRESGVNQRLPYLVWCGVSSTLLNEALLHESGCEPTGFEPLLVHAHAREEASGHSQRHKHMSSKPSAPQPARGDTHVLPGPAKHMSRSIRMWQAPKVAATPPTLASRRSTILSVMATRWGAGLECWYSRTGRRGLVSMSMAATPLKLEFGVITR